MRAFYNLTPNEVTLEQAKQEQLRYKQELKEEGLNNPECLINLSAAGISGMIHLKDTDLNNHIFHTLVKENRVTKEDLIDFIFEFRGRFRPSGKCLSHYMVVLLSAGYLYEFQYSKDKAIAEVLEFASTLA